MRNFFWSPSAKIMRLPRPASLQGPSSTLRPSGPVLPRSRSFYGRAFPAFSLLRLPPPLPLTLPPVVSCPFRHRGGSVPCLPVVCWCCPFLLSWLSAYVLFPCFFWQSSPVYQIRPDPVYALRSVVSGLLRSTGEPCSLPLCLPLLLRSADAAPPYRRSSPVCSGADPLRCRGFPQFSLYRVESDLLPSCRLASRPSVPECGHCVVAALLWSWLYQGNIKADNRITAIGS
jgi:hypothetical protein